MNWAQLSIQIGIAGALAGAIWKAASAWTKKAIALGEKAEAEREKERQVSELRKSHANFMERVETLGKEVAAVQKGLEILSARIDERERERTRRDTRGIPMPSGDGE